MKKSDEMSRFPALLKRQEVLCRDLICDLLSAVSVGIYYCVFCYGQTEPGTQFADDRHSGNTDRREVFSAARMLYRDPGELSRTGDVVLLPVFKPWLSDQRFNRTRLAHK